MNKSVMEKTKQYLQKNWWLLAMLSAGLLLLISSSDSMDTNEETEYYTSQEIRLTQVLSKIDGVGDVCVLLAEKQGRDGGYNGAVVVCRGAQIPQVKLRVVETVTAFTGLGSNHISVQNMVS